MKKIMLPLLLIGGVGVGGGAAYGTTLLLGNAPAHDRQSSERDEKLAFVPAADVLAPLVGADGRLTGYVKFNLQLQVAEDQSEAITTKLPLLLHAINMRTYKAPMASGPDGMLPDLEVFRKVVLSAAAEALGPGTVKRAAITQAAPA